MRSVLFYLANQCNVISEKYRVDSLKNNNAQWIFIFGWISLKCYFKVSVFKCLCYDRLVGPCTKVLLLGMGGCIHPNAGYPILHQYFINHYVLLKMWDAACCQWSKRNLPQAFNELGMYYDVCHHLSYLLTRVSVCMYLSSG